MSIRLFIAVSCVFSLLLTAEVREVHILQTTDIHAQFSPRYEGDGGWLAAATVIRRLREQLGRDNTLLIDTGDNTQGTIAASITRGEAGMLPLQALQYDAWVPGNHEFDYGVPQFCKFMGLAKDIALCANLSVNGQEAFTPWKLFTRNGVKIAVIGLTNDFMPNWLLPEDAAQLRVTPDSDCLAAVLPQVCAQKPDVIILATHQGWFPNADTRGVNAAETLARQYPEIDVLLGAHSHRLVAGVRIGQRTWYTQPAAHATYVSRVTVKVDTERHQIVDVSSVAVPVEKGTEPDPELRKVVAPVTAAEIRERTRKLAGGLTKGALSRGTPGINCATSELIAMAVAEASQAQVVFHARLSNKDVTPGTLTGGDLYKLIPYDNTIVTLEVTLDELEQLVAEQWKWKKHYSYNGLYGARAEVQKDGRAVIRGFGQHDPLPEDARTRRYTVAFHSHAAAGSGRYPLLRSLVANSDCHARRLPMTTRQAVEQFLAHHPDFDFSPFPWITTP